METKRCTKCGRELPLSEFYKRDENKDGHDNKCKSCIKEYALLQHKQWVQNNREKNNAYQAEYRKKNREKIIEYRKKKKEEYYNKRKQIYSITPKEVYTKVCRVCGKELPIEDFTKSVICKYGVYCICKSCNNERRRKYYIENKGKILARTKKYVKSKKGRDAWECYKNSDGYFIRTLYKQGFPEESITPELIAFKRAHIQLKREIKAQESQEPNNNN